MSSGITTGRPPNPRGLPTSQQQSWPIGSTRSGAHERAAVPALLPRCLSLADGLPELPVAGDLQAEERGVPPTRRPLGTEREEAPTRTTTTRSWQ